MAASIIDLTLLRFERLYDRLGAAIADEDIPLIADLVNERQGVVEVLASSYDESHPIESVAQTRLAHRESLLRRSLDELRHQLAVRLGQGQAANDAVFTYNRGGQTP